MIENNVCLKKYNTWHCGGKAEFLFKPNSLYELANFFKDNHQVYSNIHFLGLGSNVLIRDGIIKGLVIHTQSHLDKIEFIEDRVVYAEAGVPVAKLAKQCAKHNKGGIEFFAGIPGTVGGALAMNAGAFGGETWENVISADVLTPNGQIITFPNEAFNYSYRKVILPCEGWFLGARFHIKDNPTSATEIKEMLQKRNTSQPIGVFSCGSVFRNPKPLYAAKLIEEVGLKGIGIGEAYVSDKHANFIINKKDSTSAQILAVMNLAKQRVNNIYGIDLIPEVRLIGYD